MNPDSHDLYYALEQICWDCQQRLPADQVIAKLTTPQQVVHACLIKGQFSTNSLGIEGLKPLHLFKFEDWQLSIHSNASSQECKLWLDGLSPKAIERTLKQLRQPVKLSRQADDGDIYKLLDSLQELTRYMDPSQTEHGFCQQVVTSATSSLGIDRMAIFMIGPEPNRMRGTWGTNDQGQVVDRSDFSDIIPGNHPMVSRALAQRDLVVVNQHATLFFNKQPVGLGWNAMVAIWSEGKAIGWVAADNLLTRKGFTLLTQETLKFLGAIAGSILSRIRSREALLQLNRELEIKVQERTQELSTSLDNLKLAQDKLIRSEKLSALGGLVAGVAHEVNTPLGIAVTASSVLGETLSSLNLDFLQGKLSKQMFSDYLMQAEQNNQLLSNNLQRAAKLISDFKKTAVDQHSDQYLRFNLADSLNALITSLHPETRKRQAKIELKCEPSLKLKGYPSLIGQIITNLIMNSLVHGFDRPAGQENLIRICIEEDSPWLKIDYQDNGLGIAKELQSRVFEPFYTTKRQQGGSGLGLSIIHNLVEKLGGTLELAEPEQQGALFKLVLPLEAPKLGLSHQEHRI